MCAAFYRESLLNNRRNVARRLGRLCARMPVPVKHAGYNAPAERRNLQRGCNRMLVLRRRMLAM